MPLTPSAPIVAPSIVRYTFQHLLVNNKRADNIADISIDAGIADTRDDVIDDFNTVISEYWQDSTLVLYATSTVYQGVTWLDLNSLGGRTGHIDPTAGHPTTGAQTGSASPPNVSTLVHKHTTSARGQKQGRWYFQGPPEAQTGDDGNISPTWRSTYTPGVQSFRQKILDYEGPSGGTLVHPAALRVVHVHKPSPLDATTWTWSSSDVTSLTIDGFVATQRRRLR